MAACAASGGSRLVGGWNSAVLGALVVGVVVGSGASFAFSEEFVSAEGRVEAEGSESEASVTLDKGKLSLPYQAAGLSERQAAAHLLDRFAFGSRPGDVDAMVDLGLAPWIELQLAEASADEALAPRLKDLDALSLSTEQIEQQFVDPGRLARGLMRREQRKSRGADADDSEDQQSDRRALRQQTMELMREEGQRPHRVLMEQLFTNKVLRAAYSENQLGEVLTDFWFNHFNIDGRKRESRPYLFSYERDAIRPHVLGEFAELLLATATHPAMLMYLDNARSRAEDGQKTTATLGQRGGRGSQRGEQSMRARNVEPEGARRRRKSGLNENYARELMELHTLGVDGGYSQEDVIEVARAFTGWTVLPPYGEARQRYQRRLQSRLQSRLPGEPRRSQMGFVEKDGFFFNAAFHDAQKKVVLGRKLPSGRGMEDGLEVIELLADHPSTARFVTRKLAQRFVSDEPSDELVTRLAETFSQSQGEVAEVLRTLVQTEEFWLSRRQEIKSPLELVISTVRAMQADVWSPRTLGKWLEQLGQPLYRYQAPTGYPETSEFWINTGGLLNRMNFGLEAAEGLLGVRVNLLALLDGHEPESYEEALLAFASVLLPERDPAPTVAVLLPSLGIDGLEGQVSRRTEQPNDASDPDFEMALVQEPEWSMEPEISRSRALIRIVGLLIGSPEFQRR